MSSFFSCDRCRFRCKAKIELVKHLFEAHCTDPNFTYSCPIAECTHVFKLGCTYYSSFRSHVSRKHHDWKDQLAIQQPAVIFIQNEPGDHGNGSDTEQQTEATVDFSGGGTTDSLSAGAAIEESGPSSLSRSAAHFLLTLKERYGLTQSAVNYAVGSVNQMIDDVREELQTSVEKYLEENEVARPSTLGECFTPMNPFSGRETEYQQAKHYREHFGLVVKSCVF